MPAADCVEIFLEAFEGIARIEGTGSVEVLDGYHVVKGQFSLWFAGAEFRKNDPIDPSREKVIVERRSNGWYLVFAPYLSFSDGSALFASNYDPEIQISSISIGRFGGSTTPVRVKVDSFKLGVSRGLFDAASPLNALFYPRDAGNIGSIRLAEGSHPNPDISGVGYWVLPDQGYLSIKCGTPQAAFDIELNNAVRLSVLIASEWTFRLPFAGVGITTGSERTSIAIETNKELGSSSIVKLDTVTETAFFAKRYGRVETSQTCELEAMEISGNWLTVTRFSNKRGSVTEKGVTIAKTNLRENGVPKFADDKQGFSRLDAADHESLKLSVWMHPSMTPVRDGKGTEMPKAMFVYRDRSVSEPGNKALSIQSPRQRYTGLRIRGMGHAGAKQIKLDGDWIVAPLVDKDGKSVFEIEGGQEKVAIPAALPFIQSEKGLTFTADTGNAIIIDKTRLFPKKNPSRNDRREYKIPAGSVMAVDLGGEGYGREPGRSTDESLSFSTKDGLLRITNAKLYGPPNGVTARRNGVELSSAVDSSNWSLGIPEGSELVLESSDVGVVPVEKEKWTDLFEGAEQTFEFKEYPGSGITIDPGRPRSLTTLDGRSGSKDLAAVSRKPSKLTVRPAKDRELMVYEQLFSELAYKAIAYFIPDDSKEVALNDSKIALKLTDILEEQDGKPWFPSWVPRNFGVDDLLVAFYCGSANSSPAEARQQFKEFIKHNLTSVDNDGTKRVLWPFLPGIAVTLAEESSSFDDPDRWFWELAKTRLPAGRDKTYSGVVVDLSLKGGAGLPLGDVPAGSTDASHVSSNNFGWAPTDDLKDLAARFPSVFPKGGDGESGKRLDPRNPRWRGILFRDVPMRLNVFEEFTKHELLKGLADSIEKRLLLEIGWKDETGSCWVAGLKNPDGLGTILKESWKDICGIYLRSFSTTGAEGKALSAGGVLFFQLPKLKNKDTNEPFTLETSCVLNITDDVKIERIAVSANGYPDMPTVSIPGFEKLKLTSLVTDLRNADFGFDLFSSQGLANVFPFLKGGNPLKARLRFNFDGPELFNLALLMPSEEDTKLFGRWPFTLQGIRVQLDDNTTKLTVKGALNLGVGPFARVGTTVTVQWLDGELKLKLRIDEIGGKLDLGDGFYVAGGLRWGEKPNTWTREDDPEDTCNIPLSDIGGGNHEEKNDIWGYLDVRTKLFGDAGLYVRIAEQGETSFWVCAVRAGANIPIGIGELQKPFFLMARNADLTGGGSSLGKILGDLSLPISGNLRIDPDPSKPSGWSREPLDWLSDWQYSADIGTVYAGSAYLHVHDQLAKSPEASGKSKLTSIAFSDSGLLRIDGYCSLLDGATYAVAIGIDYRQRRFSFGLQLPEVSYPPQSPTFSISAGFLGIAFGFCGNTYLKGSLGWPLTGGDNPVPDWDRAVKVHWADAWPINTLWGGLEFEAEQQGASYRIRNGVALRAGWTRTYSEGFKGVASASASLTVAVGGSVIYTLTVGGSPCNRVSESATSLYRDVIAPNQLLRQLDCDRWRIKAAYISDSKVLSNEQRQEAQADLLAADSIMASAELIEKDVFAISASFSLAMSSSLYATVSGSASAQFLGVTVASIGVGVEAAFTVCGDTCDGITQVSSYVQFDVKVEIACVTYTTTAERDIYLVEGPCRASFASLAGGAYEARFHASPDTGTPKLM